MSTDLELRRKKGGPALTQANVGHALASIWPYSGMRFTLDAGATSTIRVRAQLGATDPDAAGFSVTFASDGSKVIGSTRGGGGPLLYLCFHGLADALGCVVFDPQEGKTSEIGDPTPLLTRAKQVVAESEAEVLSDRPWEGGEEESPGAEYDVVHFLLLLARDEKILLAEDTKPTDLARLQTLGGGPEALYEALLEAPEIDDVFLGEREFMTALRKFRATVG